MKLRYILLLFIVSLLLFSCGVKKQPSNNSSMDYQTFRNSQKTFSTSDGNIKYIDQGQGDVILLLHGIPASSWLYRKMIDSLSVNHRVIAPDMLGFGSSDNPKGYEIYNAEQHGKRIIELMDGLQIKQWNHITHDGGGLWTWEILKANKDRIKRLVLLNTIIFEEGFHPPMRMKKGLFAKFTMWLYKNGITTNLLLKGLFKNGLMENNLTKTAIEGYKKPLREGKVHAMYYFFSQTCNVFPDNSEVIESLDIPVSVIWGAHDEMLQWEPQKEQVIKALNIQKEDIHILNAKHFIQEEKPIEVSAFILDFIKK